MTWLRTLIYMTSLGLIAFVATVNAKDVTRAELAKQMLQIYMETMDPSKIAKAYTNIMIVGLRKKYPDIYAKKGDKIRKIMEDGLESAIKKAYDGLDEKIATVFTIEELQAMVKFNSSDVGRSITKKMPQYMAIIEPAVMKAVRGSMPVVLKKLETEGIKPPSK